MIKKRKFISTACVLALFCWLLAWPTSVGHCQEQGTTRNDNTQTVVMSVQDFNTLRTNLTMARQELTAARTQQQDLNNQVKKLQEQLSQSTKQVQVLDSQSVTLNSQVQTLQEQLSQSRQEVQTLKRDLIQSQNALTNAKTSLTSTTQAVQAQEKQYRKNERALKRQVSAWKVATVAAFFLGLKIDF